LTERTHVEPTATPNDRTAIQQRLIARAVADDAFRAQLLADPHTAVADELGVDLPDGLAIVAVEEEAGKLYLVLPPATRELTDAELDSVAGAGDKFNPSMSGPTRNPQNP
jgi:hypothetical protein